MNLKTLQTRLETASIDEVEAILDRKVEEVGANRTADYIYTSIDNLDNNIKRIDEAIKELQTIKKNVKSQQEIIKIGASKWLLNNGVDKLQGDLVSSISVSQKQPSYELIIEDEESLINAGYFTMSVDKTAVKNALLDGVELKGAKLEVTYNEDSIRVNKRKKWFQVLLIDFTIQS